MIHELKPSWDIHDSCYEAILWNLWPTCSQVCTSCKMQPMKMSNINYFDHKSWTSEFLTVPFLEPKCVGRSVAGFVSHDFMIRLCAISFSKQRPMGWLIRMAARWSSCQRWMHGWTAEAHPWWPPSDQPAPRRSLSHRKISVSQRTLKWNLVTSKNMGFLEQILSPERDLVH